MNRYIKHCLGATAIVSFLVSAAACVITKSPEQESQDRTTENAVRSALQADAHIYTDHIKIHVDKGVVHLSGYVWTDFDMYTAQQDALSVDGVTRVVNDMELELEGIGNSPYSD
jgi:osmotically-inducible protein OsmY